MREASVERGFLEPFQVVRNGGFGIAFALDVGGAAAMLETPAAAIALLDVLETENGELHVAPRAQDAAGFLEVRAILGFEQMREERVGEDEVCRCRFEGKVETIRKRSGGWLGLDDGLVVGRAVGRTPDVGRHRVGGPGVVRSAEGVDLVEEEVIAREVCPAPVEHLVVDVDANVLAREAAIVEEEVAEREGEAAAATAKVDDGGIEADQSALESVEPEGDGKRLELSGVEQDAIPYAHADAQVVRGQVAELAIWEAQNSVEQVQGPHQWAHARERGDGRDEAADGLVGEGHDKG